MGTAYRTLAGVQVVRLSGKLFHQMQLVPGSGDVAEQQSGEPIMITRKEQVVADLESWYRLAAPRRNVHWKDGRSAKESARAWIGASPELVPNEIHATLTLHPDFCPIEEWTAEPEARVPFDSFRGEPSNVDVLLLARDQSGPFVVAVEAKADETFGATLETTAQAAKKRLSENPRSRGLKRLEQLTQAILGVPLPEADVGRFRYQLLTASAAALAEAERRSADRAVLLVHEFVTDRTSDELHGANARDLDSFVLRISGGAIDSLRAGELAGPFQLRGEPLVSRPVSFYVGKAVRDLRTD